jgi:hemerythrin
VDAGPHITRSLDALGIGPAEVEGIFHTHAHDDHFAGLTSLVRSDRRLKYFAVPYVRASVQKKLAALMRIDEDRFSRYFDVHDLVPGEWNRIGALDVKPVYSPHPVETTVFFFRAGAGSARRTYAHLADIASFEVLARIAAPTGGRPAAMNGTHHESLLRELTRPVDLKKIDVGGGLIHGDADDFRTDESKRILLSHGVPESPGDHSARVTTVGFGESDVLIAGEEDYFQRTALACLVSWFPRCPRSEVEFLARCPKVDIPPGNIVYSPAVRDHDVRLIVSGVAEETDPSTGKSRRLGVGSFAGGYSVLEAPTSSFFCRAQSAVTVVSIPARTYTDFMSRNGGAGVCRELPVFREVLAICPAFVGIRTESVLNAIAAAMTEKHLAAGAPAPADHSPTLYVLARGDLDIAVGSQLVETLPPGGFWGEERIVSAAPSLIVARAASDCTYLTVPAELLADIPIVQWELLETFERRLRSFRAGFRFEWSPSFRVGVTMLDEQHRDLFAYVNTLSEAIGRTGIVEGHDAEKRAVLDFARRHFADEEALMKTQRYPRFEVQAQAHRVLLSQLEMLVNAAERRSRPRSETAVDYLKDWLIKHTLLEDLQYKEFFTRRGIT